MMPKIIMLFFWLGVVSGEDVAMVLPTKNMDEQQRAVHEFSAILSKAPTIRALSLRYAAAQRAEYGAGRLPDPVLGLGYARLRMPMENRPIYEAMLEQPLPRWGERDAERARSVATTSMAAAEMRRDIGMLAEQVAMRLAELEGLQARITEGNVEQQRIRALSGTISARVGQGDASVIDRLAIDSRLVSLQVRVADWERQMTDKAQDIRAWLALPIDQPLPKFAAPLPATIEIEQSPEIRQAFAQRDDALAALQTAQSMRRPMTSVGIRGMLEDTVDGTERTIGATLSISLPVAQGAMSAEIDAAFMRVHAAERLIDAARLQTRAAADIARRAIEQAQRTTALIQTLITRTNAEQQALMIAAAGAGTSIITLLEVTDRLAELRVELIDATVSANQARAALWSHVSLEVPIVTERQP